MIGKEEFSPFSAEVHYFRVNKRHWSFCFERIRRAGIKIISTVIPWNLHETIRGEFDFIGRTDARKDLVVFLELAREFGFKLIVRPGPYINAEWFHGGYPDYLFEMQDILARDNQGQLVPLPGNGHYSSELKSTGSKFPPRQPSWGHARYKNQVKKYINNLCEILKNYSFPKGPIFAIQLDHQPGQGDTPFAYDYNPEVGRVAYGQFLQGKYQDIKSLKSIYREKWKSFEEVMPPQSVKLKQPVELTKYFDWEEFKQSQFGAYMKNLKEYYQENEVSVIFFGNYSQHREVLPNLNYRNLAEEKLFPTGEAKWEDDVGALERQLKFWGNGTDFPWLTLFHCGNTSSHPDEHRKYFPVSPAGTKFMFNLALASGVKAFNFYMFVDRENWYDSPLGNDGSIQPNYDMLSKLLALNEKIPFNQLESTAKVGLALYQPYAWYRSLDSRVPYQYFNQLYDIFAGLSRDLGYLKVDYRVLDFEAGNFENCDLIFIPSAEFMSQAAQEKIVSLVKSGKKVILYGLVPQLNLDFKPCKILSKFLKLKSTPGLKVAEVKNSQTAFPAQVISNLSKSGRGQKDIMRDKGKLVASRMSAGKGAAYFFGFDFTTGKNPQKLLYLENLLSENKIYPDGYCGDLEVLLKVQKFQKAHVLYLFNPAGSFWHTDGQSKREVIVKLDAKRLGIKGSLKLTELVTGEIIKTSARELSEGLVFTLSNFDSRIYLLGKK